MLCVCLNVCMLCVCLKLHVAKISMLSLQTVGSLTLQVVKNIRLCLQTVNFLSRLSKHGKLSNVASFQEHEAHPTKSSLFTVATKLV